MKQKRSLQASMKRKHLAWHFVGKTLRDGSPIPKDGEWLEHKGELRMCESGLHWSRQPFDALQYAPGETLCLVEIGGAVVEFKGDNKGISTKRKIVVRMNATELLRYFARMQVLSVIHLNEDLPEVVEDYLMTGDESIKDAAWAAARAAAGAGAAARSAAEDAAWAAARAAAWDAAWAVARAAAGAAARAAARDAAREHFNQLVYESFEKWL
jgi:hypothetical protein